jgi:histidyl-tRNA synthetase
MQAAGLKKVAFKVSHIGVLRGILTKERLMDKAQSAVMQLMDKKQYEDAFKLVESTGVSETCMPTLRKLVELKGNNVLDVVDRVAELVRNYEKSVEAARNLGEILSLVLKSKADVDITVDAGFARGLEYYTGMILEVYVPDLNIALAGGGRYDKLIELFGGDPTPAVGVAHGVDRIMLALQEQKAAHKTIGEAREEETVLVIPTNEKLRSEALRISQMLRDAGVPAEFEVMGRKMAKALEDADRRKMGYALIIGERELKEGTVVLRNLARRAQSTVKIEDIAETLKISS